MKILITGGTGFVGSALTARLLTAGHEVTVIGSSPQCRLPAHPQLTYVSANTTRPGDWQRHVAAQDALVNLAGRSVFNLWTESYKKSIYDSRILTTRNLVDALPAGSEAVSPCDTCEGQPCLATCPVAAFDSSGYDVAACAAHIGSAAGAMCMTAGCRARAACPVGAAHTYPPAQVEFHMAAFKRAHPS